MFNQCETVYHTFMKLVRYWICSLAQQLEACTKEANNMVAYQDLQRGEFLIINTIACAQTVPGRYWLILNEPGPILKVPYVASGLTFLILLLI